MLLDYHNNWILVISAMAQYHIKTNLLPGKHFGVCYFIDVFVALLRGWKSNRDLFFFFEKDIFFVLSRAWNKRNSESLGGIEPQTFGFPAPMLYHRDSTVSKAYYEVLIWHASCIMHHGPSLPWNLCGSVLEHQSAESAGLTCDSSKRLRIFPLSHARDMTKKLFSLFLYRA